jgi:hypothetical protein
VLLLVLLKSGTMPFMPVLSDNALAAASPEAALLYQRLRAALQPFGPFQEEVKKTSVHLVRKSAFVGVHFRRNHIQLTIKATGPIDSPRIVQTEQVSKNRWHCEVKVTSEADVDRELLAWAKTAYELCA